MALDCWQHWCGSSILIAKDVYLVFFSQEINVAKLFISSEMLNKVIKVGLQYLMIFQSPRWYVIFRIQILKGHTQCVILFMRVCKLHLK